MPDDTGLRRGGWDGATYYGREQVKAAPFNNWLVGSYIFLAGLSGGAAMLSALLDLSRGDTAAPVVRRGRWLSLLAPTVGAICLISDLHTPRRFYNMLRLVKITSPMSIGSWLLIAFGTFSTAVMGGELLGRVPALRWMRGLARVAQVPAAITGAGMGSYTAGLLSATSTPLWAAAPRATALRFASSSIASAAAALSLGLGRSRLGRQLDELTLAALALELAGTISADESYRRTGVAAAMETLPGLIEETGATGVGTVFPLALHLLSLGVARRRSPILSALASCAVLLGSATFRIAFLAAGDELARRPEISFRFVQPETEKLMRGWPVAARR